MTINKTNLLKVFQEAQKDNCELISPKLNPIFPNAETTSNKTAICVKFSRSLSEAQTLNRLLSDVQICLIMNKINRLK